MFNNYQPQNEYKQVTQETKSNKRQNHDRKLRSNETVVDALSRSLALKDGTIQQQQQQQQQRSVLNPKANSFVDDLSLGPFNNQDQLRNIQTMINKHSNDYDNEYGNKNNIGDDLLSSVISHIHTTDLESDVCPSSSFGRLPPDTSFSFPLMASKSLGLRTLSSPSMTLLDNRMNGLSNHDSVDDHISIKAGHSMVPCLMPPSSNSSNSREAKCSSGVKTSFIDVSN